MILKRCVLRSVTQYENDVIEKNPKEINWENECVLQKDDEINRLYLASRKVQDGRRDATNNVIYTIGPTHTKYKT